MSSSSSYTLDQTKEEETKLVVLELLPGAFLVSCFQFNVANSNRNMRKLQMVFVVSATYFTRDHKKTGVSIISFPSGLCMYTLRQLTPFQRLISGTNKENLYHFILYSCILFLPHETK